MRCRFPLSAVAADREAVGAACASATERALADELRRSFDPEFSDDFVVIKRVPVKSLSDWAVGALMSELVNGMAMHHQHIVQISSKS